MQTGYCLVDNAPSVLPVYCPSSFAVSGPVAKAFPDSSTHLVCAEFVAGGPPSKVMDVPDTLGDIVKQHGQPVPLPPDVGEGGKLL